ncbi:hypothetical protein AVEN_60771-1 [Araneus ventricosus]|uniref:Uncharacterized protein n=1 Tax=Araneus ventricosus TaxID=182803 RepID=A0A4Y2WXZ4_ARAVE|nr:hypothetical protein AVEN_60771-1 [Araneus ventricosus]
MTRTTPELAPPLQTSTPLQREDVWPPTYDDLTCNKPNKQRIFSGIVYNTNAKRLFLKRYYVINNKLKAMFPKVGPTFHRGRGYLDCQGSNSRMDSSRLERQPSTVI